jgi:hypothetical protein
LPQAGNAVAAQFVDIYKSRQAERVRIIKQFEYRQRNALRRYEAMNHSRLLLVFLASLGLLWAGQPSQAAPASAPSQDSLLQSIQSAADPSTAVAAYANAVSSLGDSVLVEQSYVRRMVDLGLPELAEAQAQDLTRRSPGDGLPWSVAAFMSARRGENAAALAQIGVAVNSSPDDPFVQRTAGQLLAWYDTQADPARIAAMARLSAESVRLKLKDRAAFTEAYAQSHEVLTGQAAAPATQPGGEIQPQPYAATSTPATQDYITPPTIYDSGENPYIAPYGSAYSTYTDPYPYWGYGYSYYQPWWPSTYFYSVRPFPIRGSGSHDDHHDHDRDHSPRWNDSRFSGSNRNAVGTGQLPPRIIRGVPARPMQGSARGDVRGPEMHSAPPPHVMPQFHPQGGMRSGAPMMGAGSRSR